jgi:hypothetical protein
MTREYPAIHKFTPEGIEFFRSALTGQLDESALNPLNPLFTQRVEGTSELEVRDFATAKEMAQEICRSFGDVSPQALAGDIGVWAWLTFVLLDVLFPRKGGIRKSMELFRWYPAPPSDWRKAQRHLVRMPVTLFHAFGKDADHLICGKPSIGPEIREQLTSQQDMFSDNFQRAARMLYFDDENGTVKRGASSKEGGVVRRLATVRQQLDVTWDMTDLSAERILGLLPKEFDRFKDNGVAA